jgi:iron(III) transport system permease protein
MRGRIARLRDSGNLAWSVAALVISLIAIAPMLAIGALALQSSGDTWPHLIANVLPGSDAPHPALMAGIAALTLLLGTGTACSSPCTASPGEVCSSCCFCSRGLS